MSESLEVARTLSVCFYVYVLIVLLIVAACGGGGGGGPSVPFLPSINASVTLSTLLPYRPLSTVASLSSSPSLLPQLHLRLSFLLQKSSSSLSLNPKYFASALFNISVFVVFSPRFPSSSSSPFFSNSSSPRQIFRRAEILNVSPRLPTSRSSVSRRRLPRSRPSNDIIRPPSSLIRISHCHFSFSSLLISSFKSRNRCSPNLVLDLHHFPTDFSRFETEFIRLREIVAFERVVRSAPRAVDSGELLLPDTHLLITSTRNRRFETRRLSGSSTHITRPTKLGKETPRKEEKNEREEPRNARSLFLGSAPWLLLFVAVVVLGKKPDATTTTSNYAFFRECSCFS